MPTTNNLNELVDLLYNTIGLIREQIKAQDRFKSMSMASVRTLHFIAARGEPTMKEIADFLYITPPSATVMIQHDVKAGRIQRLYDKNDRRIVRLKITEAGRKYVQDCYKNMSAGMKKILAKLNDKQIKELTDILETMAS